MNSQDFAHSQVFHDESCPDLLLVQEVNSLRLGLESKIIEAEESRDDKIEEKAYN